MMKTILGSFLLVTSVFSKDPQPKPPPHKSPQQIQAELDQAERDFAHALTLFNPWYSGPIVAGSPTMMPPAAFNLQPYFYAIDNYGSFNSNSDSVHNPNPLWQIQLQPVFQTGITSWMDFATAATWTSNFRNGQSYTGVTDMPLIVGFKLLAQGVWVPGIKATVGETLPIGKYEHLSVNKQGTDSTGGGSWVTSFSLRFGKVLFWWTRHPLNTRLYLSYSIPSTVHVSGLNSYGGGYGTSGKVRPGNSFTADLGLEWSLTQRWVLATDVIYTASARTKFNGYAGTDPSTGGPASVGSGSSYSFQLAPALEYNWSSSLAAIGGIWFTPYGRNSGKFVNYTISVTWSYPP
ncbi:MAG TPA: hypothetical protein VHL30_01335 [Chlamydiales bacterium]|nr:hypothetical protein [Chlamydiales bacterium]